MPSFQARDEFIDFFSNFDPLPGTLTTHTTIISTKLANLIVKIGFVCMYNYWNIYLHFLLIISGMDLSRESFTNKKSSSLLYYTPKSQMDYGTVLCVASNVVGRQIVPCIYHVIPAGMKFFVVAVEPYIFSYFCYNLNFFTT